MSYFDESDIPAGYRDADLETLELEAIGRQLAALDAVLPVYVPAQDPAGIDDENSIG